MYAWIRFWICGSRIPHNVPTIETTESKTSNAPLPPPAVLSKFTLRRPWSWWFRIHPTPVDTKTSNEILYDGSISKIEHTKYAVDVDEIHVPRFRLLPSKFKQIRIDYRKRRSDSGQVIDCWSCGEIDPTHMVSANSVNKEIGSVLQTVLPKELTPKICEYTSNTYSTDVWLPSRIVDGPQNNNTCLIGSVSGTLMNSLGKASPIRGEPVNTNDELAQLFTGRV